MEDYETGRRIRSPAEKMALAPYFVDVVIYHKTALEWRVSCISSLPEYKVKKSYGYLWRKNRFHGFTETTCKSGMDLSYCCVGAFSYTDTGTWDNRMGAQPGCFYYFHYCDGKGSRWRRCYANGLCSYRFPNYVFYRSWDIGTFFVASTEDLPLVTSKTCSDKIQAVLIRNCFRKQGYKIVPVA